MPVSRRALLGLMSSGTFLVTAGAVGAIVPGGAPRLSFPQGVASGDPQADAVMLWTRAVPGSPTPRAPVRVQVSRDPDFESPVLDTLLAAEAESDYTLRVFVEGLDSATRYFYRFSGADDSFSRVGRTCTAPAPGQDNEVRLAFVSCQSYEQAYYGNWARMLEDDANLPKEQQIDFVLHLGDFIYERIWPKLTDGTPVPRPLPPFPDGAHGKNNSWALTLADYRHLYKTYLSDPHLQAARARWPFVCTWDDHEFSNDNFGNFTTYGREPREESARKVASNRAWFEFIPAVLSEADEQPAHDFKTPQGPLSGQAAVDSLRIYRRLQWGKNLDIILTDSRSYRSEACLPEDLSDSLGLVMDTVKLVEMADAGEQYDGGKPPQFLPYGDGTVPNPGRTRTPGTLLGEEQRNWFLQQMNQSTARWKLWGNALPLIPIRLDLGSLPFTDYEDSIIHIDAWAGYPHEQSLIMKQLQEAGTAGVVSFSGDHHMHGAGAVRHNAADAVATPVAVDFSVAGISSSPMFGELYKVSRKSHADFAALVFDEKDGIVTPVWNMTMLDGALASLAYSKAGLRSAARWLGPSSANPGLKYMDCNANGYGLASFNADTLQVQMITLNNILQPFEQAPEIDHIARFELPLWLSGQGPDLQGPEFERGAPFPFTPPSV